MTTLPCGMRGEKRKEQRRGKDAQDLRANHLIPKTRAKGTPKSEE
jgi:hypothetical protein